MCVCVRGRACVSIAEDMLHLDVFTDGLQHVRLDLLMSQYDTVKPISVTLKGA